MSIPQLSLNSSVWGSNYWTVLYCIGLSYPDTPSDAQKNKTKAYLSNLVLPCDICQQDYDNDALVDYPVTDDVVANRENLLQWIINIKNRERIRNGITPLTSYDIYMYWSFYDNKTVKDGEYFCCDAPTN